MKSFLLFVSLSVSIYFSKAQNSFTSSKDVFGTRTFIENNGQFKKLSNGKAALYVIEQSNETFNFTKTGFNYTYFENIKVGLKETEEIRKRKLRRQISRKSYEVELEWLNTNSDFQIIPESKQSYYMSYGDRQLQSNCFKKITYKNIYNNIDIEYLINDDEEGRFLKYNIILHPGANYKDIKFKYNGANLNVVINASGELMVRGVLNLITESKPLVITTSNKLIEASFVQKNESIQFKLKGVNGVVNEEIVIDPWINTLAPILNNNYGYEIDYDNAGNTYVYGGTPPFKLAKYNNLGVFQWVFAGSVASVSWNYMTLMDGFCVNKTTGRVYIAGAVSSNARVIALNTAGVYDNFITSSYLMGELWRLKINPITNDITSYGDGGQGHRVTSINQTNASVTNTFILGNSLFNLVDVTCAVIDAAGHSYYAGGNGIYSNSLFKLNPVSTNTMWIQSSTYPVMTEATNMSSYVNIWSTFINSGAYNCLAVNCSNLFYYDGIDLAAFDKITGLKTASITIPGNVLKKHGGIAVDECNNIYIGGDDKILCYKLIGNTFSSAGQIAINATTTVKDVYDVAYNSSTNLLHVCGSGFVGTFNAINSSTCSVNLACFQQLSSYNFSICPGASATLNINNPNNLQNPTYSVQPGSLTSSTSSFVVTPTVPTTYSVYVTGTLNSSVITQSATISVGFFPTAIANPIVTNGTCANPVTSSVNLNVTFSPNVSTNYTVSWLPVPGSYTPVNTSTAGGLMPGINNLTLTSENGCVSTTSFSVPPIPLTASFVISNSSNDYTVTCLNPNVLLTASVTNGVPLTFTWFPTCTGSVVGTSMNFNQSCTGQVVGTSSTGCQMVQTFTIFQDISSPTIIITPTVQNVTCTGGSGCFTLTSNMGPNVTTNWFQVFGTNTVYVGAAQGTINVFCAGAPGDYWGESVNNLTGCKSTQSVQVTASVGVPIFTITSPSNFTIGCSTTSLTSMQVTSVITSPTLNVAVNYTFMIPPVTSTPTTFTANPNLNNITIPGTYVVYVKDITNNCISSQSISIIQNTIVPNIDFIQPLSILSCKDPSMVLNGISSNSNTSITWTVPASPSNSINPTANNTVTIKYAVTGATNNITSVGIFTVGSVDNNNKCSATKTVQILQDIRLPKFTISALSNSVITCANSDVVIVPIVTPSLAVALVPTYIWYPPSGLGVPGSQINTTSPGTHTSISTSAVNGCTYAAIYDVAVDVNSPALELLSSPFILDCNTNPTVALTPSITGSTTGFTYSWTAPPGAITSNLNVKNLVSNKIGFYFISVTNTINGCVSHGLYEVAEGGINASFVPDNEFGYAPLTVNFDNTSSTSTGASSIVSTWGFGNGVTTATVFNTYPVSATYTAAGTYTVYLKAQKGTCVDVMMKVITVELPSKIEVPNVFTPNGDKANDIFRLRSTSLKEVEIIVFDRWGNSVYELTSDTGNFAWDGKNQFGKECAEGTYFYILKATGKDGQEYELKGSVSLFR